MIEKINEKVLLGVVIVGVGAIGLELKKMDEKLDNQFNNRSGYYTEKEYCRRLDEALSSIREEREKREKKEDK